MGFFFRFPVLLRQGQGRRPEGEGGRGVLRQVQVAAPLLALLRGIQIFRYVKSKLSMIAWLFRKALRVSSVHR